MLILVLGLAVLQDSRLRRTGSPAPPAITQPLVQNPAWLQRLLRFRQQTVNRRTRGYATLVRTVAALTTTTGLGLLLLLLLPQPVIRMARTLEDHTLQAFVLGLALLVGSMLLALLAVIGVVTLPFVPLVGLALSLGGGLGIFVVALALGRTCRHLLHAAPGAAADLVTGTLLLGLALVLPQGGQFLLGLAACFGLGSVALSGGGRR